MGCCASDQAGGSTPNAADEQLLHSAIAGDVDAVNAALQTGADPNFRSKDGRTPLLAAVDAGKPDVVKQLIAAGADIEARNQMGRTPLATCVLLGDITMLELLLNHGANMEAATSIQAAPWLVLMDDYNPDERDAKGVVRALEQEAKRRSLGGISHCMSGQPSALTLPSMWVGMTPLLLAAQIGNADVARLLVNAGANTEATCKAITRWVVVKTRRLRQEELQQEQVAAVVDVLIKIQFTDAIMPQSDADAGKGRAVAAGMAYTFEAMQRDSEDAPTPLMLASAENKIEVMEVLLSAGANPTATSAKNGRSVLHDAVAAGSAEQVELLMGYHASLDIIDVRGFSPVVLAIVKGDKSLLPLMMSDTAGGWQAADQPVAEAVIQKLKQHMAMFERDMLSSSPAERSARGAQRTGRALLSYDMSAEAAVLRVMQLSMDVIGVPHLFPGYRCDVCNNRTLVANIYLSIKNQQCDVCGDCISAPEAAAESPYLMLTPTKCGVVRL